MDLPLGFTLVVASSYIYKFINLDAPGGIHDTVSEAVKFWRRCRGHDNEFLDF